jgi:hypothetical protein
MDDGSSGLLFVELPILPKQQWIPSLVDKNQLGTVTAKGNPTV